MKTGNSANLGRICSPVSLHHRPSVAATPLRPPAEKLSYREDLGGQLGAPEFFDDEATVQAKVKQLAQLVC